MNLRSVSFGSEGNNGAESTFRVHAMLRHEIGRATVCQIFCYIASEALIDEDIKTVPVPVSSMD